MSIVQAKCSACGNRFRTNIRQGIITALATRGLIGKVWPTMKSDKLMVPRSIAVAELNFSATGARSPMTNWSRRCISRAFWTTLSRCQLAGQIRGLGQILPSPENVPLTLEKTQQNQWLKIALLRLVGRKKKGSAAAPTAPSRGSTQPARKNEHDNR